jgi:hypothetical protein
MLHLLTNSSLQETVRVEKITIVAIVKKYILFILILLKLMFRPNK